MTSYLHLVLFIGNFQVGNEKKKQSSNKNKQTSQQKWKQPDENK